MNSEGHPFLDIKNLIKDFGGLRAVNNVSLELREGEIRGLIGPNGSGKTTMINLITGIYNIDHGAIYFSGDRIDGLPAQCDCREGYYADLPDFQGF